jgi:hypothetical protein
VQRRRAGRRRIGQPIIARASSHFEEARRSKKRGEREEGGEAKVFQTLTRMIENVRVWIAESICVTYFEKD